jgi:hypothetical protein
MKKIHQIKFVTDMGNMGEAKVHGKTTEEGCITDILPLETIKAIKNLLNRRIREIKKESNK